MRGIAGVAALLLIAAATHAGDAQDQSWEVRGRVIDAQGNPVEEAVVCDYWSANGVQWDEQGTFFKLNGQADVGKIWKNEGVLETWPSHCAKRLPGGEFLLSVKGPRPRVAVFATDGARRRGGIVAVEKSDAGQPVTIKLVPLVRVTGKIHCPEAGKTPGWTMAVAHLPGDKENYLHPIQCGSLKGEFSVLLPPGTYDLDVYSEEPDAHMPKPLQRRKRDAPVDMPGYLAGIRIEVPPAKESLDLGVLNVVPSDSESLVYFATVLRQKTA